MGMNAAEGFARTFGLGRPARSPQNAQAQGEIESMEDGYEEDGYIEEDYEEEDADVDQDGQDGERDSPVDALISATDQLAVTITDEQVQACPFTMERASQVA